MVLMMIRDPVQAVTVPESFNISIKSVTILKVVHPELSYFIDELLGFEYDFKGL